MKKSSSLLLLFILSLISIKNVEAKKLKAYISYYTFNTPENKPFVETHFSIIGSSVEYKNIKAGTYQGSIGITIIFKKGTEIVSADKFNLLSQEIIDTTKVDFIFLDQKRTSLPNGKYTMELTITDNNNAKNTESVSQEIDIDYNDKKINSSDIILIESYSKSNTNDAFTRNGYKLLPIVNNFIPTNITKLTFYHEIYNTQKISPNESYLLDYYIQNAEGLNKLNSYSLAKKVLSKDVIVTLSEFDISLLPSGNYNLIVELRNRNNEIIESASTFFQRSNKALGEDVNDFTKINVDNSFASKFSKQEIKDYIKSLNPISTTNEITYVKTLLAVDDETQMKQYLVYFWQKRFPGSAEQEWLTYKTNVDLVNEKYGSRFTKGYDTDRGVTYLKYGPPSVIRSSDFDNKAYPYEVWHYYKVKQFTNRRFVFFSPENIKNEMVLLHSNMFGERNDPNWKYKILSRTMKYSEDERSEDLEYFGQRLEADYND
jgi:GWxTD domain-containing protein